MRDIMAFAPVLLFLQMGKVFPILYRGVTATSVR